MASDRPLVRYSGKRRQRGAAAVFAAVSMILGLVCIGLAVDLGYFYFARRDLQRTANMAALDAARVAGGCVGNYSNPLSAAITEASQSVVRNGGQASWVTNGQVRVGSLNGFKTVRYFDPAFNAKQRAVEVKLTRPMPQRLIPVANGGTMSATASAYSSPQATVKMGTKVLSVDTSGASSLNRLFTGLLGAPVNLDVLTYNAFLSAQVPVANILDRLDIGTPLELAGTQVSQRALLGALVAELTAQGSTLAANAAKALYNVSSASKMVLPGQVLGVANPVSGTLLTAGDIAMAVSQLAASGSLINLPVGLPAPLNGVLTLSLIQPGVPTLLVPGGIDLFPSNFASNTQVLARTGVALNLPLDVLVLHANVGLNLPLYVQAGKGTAEIDHLDCKRRGQTQNLAYVRAQTGILNVGLGTFANPSSPNAEPDYATVLDTTVSVNLLIYKINIAIKARAKATINLASANTILNQPFYEGETRHLGTPRLSEVTVNPVNISVIVDDPVVLNPLPIVSSLLNPILAALNPALEVLVRNSVVTQLTNLADQAVLPLLDTAGITVGGADVTVTNIESDTPYLFTH